MEIKYFTVDFWLNSKEYSFLVKLMNDHVEDRIFARLYDFKSGKFLQNLWFFNDYDDIFKILAEICERYLRNNNLANIDLDPEDLAVMDIDAEIFENLI